MTSESSERQVHPTAVVCGGAETADAGGSRFQIAVVGAGPVGLTTAACLSHLDHRVIAVDVARVERLRRGESPLFDAGRGRS
jgi:threonine dehydrogenase-like Zn-dependent dehydrogenase